MGDSDEFDSSEGRTPVDRPKPRSGPATDTALRLARAASILNAFASKLGADAGIVDRLDRGERPLYLRRVIASIRKNQLGLSALLDDIEKAEDVPRPNGAG